MSIIEVRGVVTVAKTRGLTAKQDKFCREYVIDLNATQAAIRAGYSQKTAGQIGHENLKKPEILARVREIQENVAAELGITAAGVLLDLQKVKARAMQAEEIKQYNPKTKEYEGTGIYKFDGYAANKALELMGKHLGMFIDKTELSGNPDAPVVVKLEGDLADYAK